MAEGAARMSGTEQVTEKSQTECYDADERNVGAHRLNGRSWTDLASKRDKSCGSSNSVPFMEAFAFLKTNTEEQLKECLPGGTTAVWGVQGTGSAIIVNHCQRGNPVLEHIHNVPLQYADKDSGMSPDYVMSVSTCCLFLSLRYHALHPNYIYDRIRALQKTGQFLLRIILCLVDVKEPAEIVKELAKAALVFDMTLLLAFSSEEAGMYIQTFKSFRSKPADMIKKKSKKEFAARLAETFSFVKSVNSTDSHMVLSHFKSFSAAAAASEHDIALLPGLGGLKAKRLHDLFIIPFLKSPLP